MTRPFWRLAATTWAAVILAAGVARADLVGLTVFREASTGGPPPPGPERWIYRVYAEFTVSGDSVSMWGFGGILGAGGIENITVNGAPGTGFTNIPDSDLGNRAPQAPFTSRDWDCYMTIGVLYGFQAPGGIDGTLVFPGTPTFVFQRLNYLDWQVWVCESTRYFQCSGPR